MVMIRRMMMSEKNLIFSHESDIDGLNAVILSKIAFDKVDYVLMPNVEELEKTFREYLESGKLEKYHKIYITDLALYNPSLEMVENSKLKEKVKVFTIIKNPSMIKWISIHSLKLWIKTRKVKGVEQIYSMNT